MKDPTRTVRMWIDNDGNLHNRALEVSESITRRIFEKEGTGRPTRVRRLATERFRERLRDMVENYAHDPDYPGLVRDLLSGTLRAVDWHELADEWIDAAMDEASRDGVESLTRV